MAARLTGVAQRRVRAQRAAHDDHQAGKGEQRDNGAGAPAGESRSPSASASTVEAISRYPTRNGSSLTTSAGMAATGPGLRHRVSAHATPQDTSATVHKYPTASGTPRNAGPHARRPAERCRLGTEPPTRPAFLGDLRVPITW